MNPNRREFLKSAIGAVLLAPMVPKAVDPGFVIRTFVIKEFSTVQLHPNCRCVVISKQYEGFSCLE